MPTKILTRYFKKYPTAWRTMERFYLSKGQNGLPEWPSYVFLPVAVSWSIVSGGDLKKAFENGYDIPVLAALGAWRPTQSIYQFHPALLRELMETKIEGNLPLETLHHLPEWCVYIRTPEMPCEGFWAHLEWDPNTEKEELRLILHFNNDLFPVIIHLVGTIEDGLQEAWEVVAKQLNNIPRNLLKTVINSLTPAHLQKTLQYLEGLVSCVLYLCSETADWSLRGTRPLNPSPRKTRKGLRLFPAPGPRVLNIGETVGSKLESAKAPNSPQNSRNHRSAPRPHVRRGHWHHYWTGPRKGPRKLILQWIHPMIVGGREYCYQKDAQYSSATNALS